MVFSAIDPPNVYGKGFVHCELSWSADGKNYTRISPNTDFIPRGSIESKAFDSHICFASAHPVKLPNETRIYYMGGTPQPQLCTAASRRTGLLLRRRRPALLPGLAEPDPPELVLRSGDAAAGRLRRGAARHRLHVRRRQHLGQRERAEDADHGGHRAVRERLAVVRPEALGLCAVGPADPPPRRAGSRPRATPATWPAPSRTRT